MSATLGTLNALFAGELEAALLEAAKQIHLNACSVLSKFAVNTTLSERALAQAAAQLMALL